MQSRDAERYLMKPACRLHAGFAVGSTLEQPKWGRRADPQKKFMAQVKVAAGSWIFCSPTAKLRQVGGLGIFSSLSMSKHKQKGKSPRRNQAGNALNEDSLAQLTSRIDQNLNEKDHKRKRPPTNASPNQSAKKQRGADGPSSKKQQEESGGNDQEALLAEILALGGDEDDLELINGVDSDDEYVAENKAPVDKKLRDELAALSKQLGFAEMAPQEASEDEAEEEVEDEEDDEEEDEEEEDEKRNNQDDERTHESRKMGNMVCLPHFMPSSSDR